MPDARIDAFRVVRDGRYPFLLGSVRERPGIRLRFNCSIASNLEGALRDAHCVAVIECAAGAERRYSVALQHAVDWASGMSTIDPRLSLTRRLRRRLTAGGRANARRAWHLFVASVAFSLGWGLFEWGNWERAAARAGDRQVLKVRHAIREALQCPDAVSVLEHALSGIGMAAFGMAVLQVYYFAYHPAAGDESTFPRWGRALLFLLIASAAATFAWPMTYGHTGPLVVPVGVAVIGWWLARPDQLSRLALNAPGRFISLVGGLAWLNFDLGWKLQQWPTTHDTLGVVLAHLGASAGMLIACSAALGAAVRRCAWLRPAPAGGQ